MEAPGSDANERGARLDSWKEIAAYLNRDVRTVQRWEKTAELPVRRLNKPGLRAVYAYTADLDRWRRDQEPGLAELEAVEPGAGAAVAAEGAGRSWRLYAIGASVVLTIAGFALRYRTTEPAPFGPFTARPITSEPGTEREPDISPDGKYIAYVYEAPNRTASLVVRPLTGGDGRTLLSGTADVWSPAWSPDGTRLAFLRGDPANTATVQLVSALGGNQRTLATVHPYAKRRTIMIGHLLAWTPDGRFVIASHQETPGKGRLVRIAVDSGEPTPITSPSDAQFDVEPSLSSDGRLLLFNRVRAEFLSDVYVQPLDAAAQPGGPARKLPSAGSWNGTPRLLETRGEVLTSSGPIPRLTLHRQRLDGTGTPMAVGIMADNAVETAIDRTSGRIVARTYRLPIDVLRFPITTERPGPQKPAVEEFVRSTYVDRFAVYSPDGARVAFVSDRSGSRQIWVADASGDNPVEWTQTFEVDGPMPAWSPDGSRIAFAGGGPAGNSQLYVVDGATRQAVKVTDDSLDYVRPAWSPDGMFLFAAAAEKAVYAVYRVPVKGGPAVKVLNEYINVIDVAPEGKGLYVARRDRATRVELEYAPMPDGRTVHLASMNFQDDAWMTRTGLYYLDRRVEQPLAPVGLVFRTHKGEVKVLAEYSVPPGRGLSVSPDGRFALTTTTATVISDLLLLEPIR